MAISSVEARKRIVDAGAGGNGNAIPTAEVASLKEALQVHFAEKGTRFGARIGELKKLGVPSHGNHFPR